MSLQVYYDILSTPVSCFGSTLAEAKANAQQRYAQLKEEGHIVSLDEEGYLVRAGVYAWNVNAKRKRYK